MRTQSEQIAILSKLSPRQQMYEFERVMRVWNRKVNGAISAHIIQHARLHIAKGNNEMRISFLSVIKSRIGEN